MRKSWLCIAIVLLATCTASMDAGRVRVANLTIFGNLFWNDATAASGRSIKARTLRANCVTQLYEWTQTTTDVAGFYTFTFADTLQNDVNVCAQLIVSRGAPYTLDTIATAILIPTRFDSARFDFALPWAPPSP